MKADSADTEAVDSCRFIDFSGTYDTIGKIGAVRRVGIQLRFQAESAVIRVDYAVFAFGAAVSQHAELPQFSQLYRRARRSL